MSRNAASGIQASKNEQTASRSSPKASPPKSQASQSQSHSAKKQRRHGSHSQSSHRVPQSSHSSKFYSYLKRENMQIQKQLLACKAELYEVKFKNKALKAKVEKLKRENMLEKQNRMQQKARGNQVEQMLRSVLEVDHPQAGDIFRVQQILREALGILSGHLYATNQDDASAMARSGVPQEQEVSGQFGGRACLSSQFLLESSYDRKQQTASSFKDPHAPVYD